VGERAARVVAVSTDDAETMKKFKAELKAPFSFVPDPEKKLVELYDVKMPAVPYANRVTFVIAEDGKVKDIKSGGDAIDPGGSIQACPLHKPKGKSP